MAKIHAYRVDLLSLKYYFLPKSEVLVLAFCHLIFSFLTLSRLFEVLILLIITMSISVNQKGAAENMLSKNNSKSPVFNISIS